MQLRQFVSDVRGTHNLLTSDTLISDRLIASVGKKFSSLLIKRETNLRRLWESDSIFTAIPCLEMVEVPIAECCDYTSPISISRSRYRLPTIGEGIFQYLIQGVFSIDGRKKFVEVSPSRYTNLLKLGHRIEQTYYWIYDGYIYTTNPDLKTIRTSIYIEDELSPEIANPSCEECKNFKPKEPCLNPLDTTFKCPGYLISQVMDLTSKHLLSTHFKVPIDHNSNDKDEQVNK